MLAARDQENLVHGQQTAAAAKPLNQGTKLLPPKTPGHQQRKSPLKLPLNDENAPIAGIGGKSVLQTQGKVNGAVMTGGQKGTGLDKNAFITPSVQGPRNRAPLGFKTTNAKAKGFQTPGAPTAKNELRKSQASERSAEASARKPKPRIANVEPTSLNVLEHDPDTEEREIEYMPPKPKELPDLPDDLPELNLDMFKGENLTRGMWRLHYNPMGEDGITQRERERLKEDERLEREADEMIQRAIENMAFDISGDSEEEMIPLRQRAGSGEVRLVGNRKPNGQSAARAKKTPVYSSGPSTVNARKASALLSIQPPSVMTKKIVPPASNTRLPSLLLRAKAPALEPTNPSPMRHTAAVAASRTTLGYSKGRLASSALSKKSIAPKKTSILSSSRTNSSATLCTSDDHQRNQTPAIGSREWMYMKQAGNFDDDLDDLPDELKGLGAIPLTLGADEDFEFPMPI